MRQTKKIVEISLLVENKDNIPHQKLQWFAEWTNFLAVIKVTRLKEL